MRLIEATEEVKRDLLYKQLYSTMTQTNGKQKMPAKLRE